jgi:CNT family concentrative nucleoside transporter
VIASYALCGFANFGSIAILIGGVGGMAPSRRGDLARLGLRAILSGTLATCMAGCFASLLLP